MSALPNVIVIGAMKCGTSALHYYLDLHPQVSMSRPKELNFFVEEPIAEAPACSLTPQELKIVSLGIRNWSKGVDWYASHFSSEVAVRGEASPEYTSPWFPNAAERMSSIVPEAKLIFIVRDPIERALKDYMILRATGREPRGIEAALSSVEGIYVSRSRYHAVLAPYRSHFPDTSLLVLGQEELRDRRRETMRSVYRFLGVEESFWDARLERERNTTTARPRQATIERLLDRTRLRRRLVTRLPNGVKWRIEQALLAIGGRAQEPQLSTELGNRLASYLRPDVENLRKATGREFSGWSI